MGTWYSVPLVIAGLVSMLGSAMVLAFSGLPYTPLSQVFDQVNPYGDPQRYVSGRIDLQGGEAQDLPGSTVVITGPMEKDPVTIYTYTTFEGSFALPLTPGTYHLEAARAGWASRTLEFEIARDDVNLGVISLLLASVGDCPGALPGEGGSLSVLGVSTSLSPTNSLIQSFDVQLSEPGVVWVEYYPRADTDKVLSSQLSAGVDTAQRFQLMRLTADTEYCFQVYARPNSDSGPVSDSFPGEFVTGPLPAGLADSSITRVSGEQTYDLTLLEFNDTDFSGFIAIDQEAKIVWYYQHSSPTLAIAQDEDFHLVFGQDDGVKFLEVEPDGTLVREIVDTLEDGTICSPGGRWHHESLLGPDGKVYFLGGDIQSVEINGELINQTGDTVVVWDRETGTVETVASLFQLLDPETDRTPASDVGAGRSWDGCNNEVTNTQDWTHSNSLWLGPEGNLIQSVRHLNQVISIAPDGQELQWRLGGPGSDFSFPDPSDQFYHQHSAKQLPNGNILLFDNGNVRPESEGGVYSRALELELDLTTMEARKVWEYRSSPDLFASCCSSAYRLANGNTVVDFGSDRVHDPCCRVFTLVEANETGEAVSVIELPAKGRGFQYRAYPLDSMNGEHQKE